MKLYLGIYLWYNLLFSGVLIWQGVQAYDKTPALALVEFVLAALSLARGLWYALTERGQNWAREQDRLNKLTEERQFGRYWSLVLWGGLALPALFLLLALWRREFLVVGLVLLGFASLYYILVGIIFSTAKEKIRRAEATAGEERGPSD